jgi:hypothetical protein
LFFIHACFQAKWRYLHGEFRCQMLTHKKDAVAREKKERQNEMF